MNVVNNLSTEELEKISDMLKKTETDGFGQTKETVGDYQDRQSELTYQS